MRSSRLIIIALLFAFSAVSYFDRTIMSIAGPALIQEFAYLVNRDGQRLLGIHSWLCAFDDSGRMAYRPARPAPDATDNGRIFSGANRHDDYRSEARAGEHYRHRSRNVSHSPGIGIRDGAALSCLCTHHGKLDATHAARSRAGIYYCGFLLGAAVSPVIFVWLMARLGWRGSFAVAAIITAALTAVWYMRASDYPAESSGRTSAIE